MIREVIFTLFFDMFLDGLAVTYPGAFDAATVRAATGCKAYTIVEIVLFFVQVGAFCLRARRSVRAWSAREGGWGVA